MTLYRQRYGDKVEIWVITSPPIIWFKEFRMENFVRDKLVEDFQVLEYSDLVRNLPIREWVVKNSSIISNLRSLFTELRFSFLYVQHCSWKPSALPYSSVFMGDINTGTFNKTIILTPDTGIKELLSRLMARRGMIWQSELLDCGEVCWISVYYLAGQFKMLIWRGTLNVLWQIRRGQKMRIY